MKFIWLAVFCCLTTLARGQASLVDPTFEVGSGADGVVDTVAVQSDGSIVVGGNFGTISGQSCSNLARLFPNGHFDASFTNGITDGEVYSVTVQPDGKIIVGGNFEHLQGAVCQGLGRLLTNGLIDTNFDAGIFSQDNGIPLKVALQPDGKILVGTIVQNLLSDNGQLLRLNTNGKPDDTFVQSNFFEGYWAHSLLVLSNGNIFVGGGFYSVNGFASPSLVLLDSSGRVNTNFQSGLAFSDIFSIVPQTNGGFLIGGILKHTNGSPDTVLERLTSNLTWDTNFVTSPFRIDFPQSYIASAFLQPDNKIVACGMFYDVGGYWRRHIVRLNADGKVDPCFDPGIGLGDFYGANVTVPQSDGRVLVGGHFGIDGFVPSNIARLLPQSDCNATRVYFSAGSTGTFAAGTFPPGGTNFLQASTNLLDWMDLDVETNSYLVQQIDVSQIPQMFFRVKKTY